MPTSRRTLRSRIVLTFALFAIAVATIFGLSTTVFLYTVEDEFFNALLSEEAARLEKSRQYANAWNTPQQRWMTVHETAGTLPTDLAQQVVAEPRRREFAGNDGRHYHLRSLTVRLPDNSTASAWLVAEVSNRLVVRPMRGELLGKWLVVEAVILFGAVGIALLMARRIARPLSVLAERVNSLAPDTMSGPIVIAGADREVTMVAGAIDEMRTRIDAFVQREQSFTRDVSHELRTPLSVIRSTTSQAMCDPAMPSASHRLLTLALQSAEHMDRTVTSLLAMTREEAVAHPAQPCHVLPVVEEVVLEQSNAIDARGLRIQLDIPHEASLRVSDVVLHMLLSNMIGNAITHAAPGTIRVQFGGGQLVVTNPILPGSVPPVQNLGAPGVKRETSPGFGLGLSILQRLGERAGLSVHWRLHHDTFHVSIGDTRTTMGTV